MSWKKYFQPYDGQLSPIHTGAGKAPGPAAANYSSYLPDVYTGSPNRVERYGQYNTMDTDSEVNAALDILAEFCTQTNNKGNHFDFKFNKPATNAEIEVLSQYMNQWCKLNEFDTRMFRIFRNVFKYGDEIFLRDPETQKLYHIDPGKLSRIIVNESKGKIPEEYVVKEINFNFKEMVATTPHQTGGNIQSAGVGYTSGGNSTGLTGGPTQQNGSRFYQDQGEVSIDAKHVLHLSLTEGLDNNYPFGNSLLETVFKVYKQKELLEDAIIIYRVQRAPERRVFYVDVGNMPSHLAMSFVERVKTEIHQRRIPSATGGGTNVIDSSYNPLSINEDYFFPQTAEGRGSKVETLPGGTNLGEIDDLRYFTNKLVRGLRIPSSYLPTGAEDGSANFQDGRVGTAYMQELRFNTYCERLQGLLVETFNREFKRYILSKGVNIDTQMFDLKFVPPQNFASYRQAELDNARVPTFGQMAALPYISNRFALERFLGLTKEEIADNERLWREENDAGMDAAAMDASAEMRMGGVSGGGIESDLGDLDAEVPDAEGIEGGTVEGGEADLGGDTGATAPATPGQTPPGQGGI